MCTPSARPGAGFVDLALWKNRENDPTSLRAEFDGPKGRAWLMKWLPARAYDNGIYAVFSNPIGMDDDQLKNGCSMVIDPFGDVIAEWPIPRQRHRTRYLRLRKACEVWRAPLSGGEEA
jgi:Carbon-nitrogen hydrolase